MPNKRLREVMHRLAAVTALVIFLCFGMGGVSVGDVESTYEYKAACLNKWRTSVPADDPTIKEFKKLLDSLEKKVQRPVKGNKRNHLVAVTFTVVDNLKRKYDKKISMLEFMRKMDAMLPSGELAPYDVRAAIYALEISMDKGKIKR